MPTMPQSSVVVAAQSSSSSVAANNVSFAGKVMVGANEGLASRKYGASGHSCDARSHDISEEMEFWYELFIKAGHQPQGHGHIA